MLWATTIWSSVKPLSSTKRSECTLATDILMGHLKLIAVRRPELKVIIMSSTLDLEAFQRFFKTARTKIPNFRKSPSGRSILHLLTKARLPPSGIISCDSGPLKRARGRYSTNFWLNEKILEKSAINRRWATWDDDRMHRAPFRAISFPWEFTPGTKTTYIWWFIPSRKPGGPKEKRKCIVATDIAHPSLTIDGIVYMIT